MSYFSDSYERIRYPIGNENQDGLRNAQLGAVHSIAAHFTLKTGDAALITMPTGSGKTAVLSLTPFLLSAQRVLVLTSSKLVRGQIYHELATLETLKNLQVLAADLDCPEVKEVKSPLVSNEQWEELVGYDAIVGIPNSINAGLTLELKVAEDLFDLLLVDEAHHVPAFTWKAIIKKFKNARKVYFTATPFRRDRKEIDARSVYAYSVRRAFEDGVFGEIGFEAVSADENDKDLAIALVTQNALEQDRENGFRHYVLARTDSKEKAIALERLYQDETNLRLRRIDSTMSFRTITRTIRNLRDDELDGIICVDMLGEGFDFPNLKIGALHSPKKSLAATLQFIGRFARTNAPDIGPARFFAVPNDIEIGRTKLYEEGAIWDEIVHDLSDEQILARDRLLSTLDKFEEVTDAGHSKKELSFYNLAPYCHVKIYEVGGINLDGMIPLEQGQEILFHAKSTELNTVVFVTREKEKPSWILSDDVVDVNHDCFLIFFDVETNFLFIHSSIKTVKYYDDLVSLFSVGGYKRISKFRINKVLVDVNDPQFFSIGMLNRSGNSGESYRIVTGSNAENTIRKSAGKNYANGHIFTKGIENGHDITIGYSSGSKVWSNAYEKIPDFLDWCKKIGSKIVSNREVITNTGFDNLPIGQVVSEFPLPAHFATWAGETYQEAPFLMIFRNGELLTQHQLLDFDPVINAAESSAQQLKILLTNDEIVINLTYDFRNFFQIADVEDNLIYRIGDDIELVDYLNERPLQIYLEDFASILDHEYYGPPNEGDFQFDSERIQSLDWESYDTDIRVEAYDDEAAKADNGNRNSVQDALGLVLHEKNPNVLIFDHGTSEIGDFVSVEEKPTRIDITFFHCKGASAGGVADRVGDLYEVCMQAVKSQMWAINKGVFRKKVSARTANREHKFLKGDMNEFNRLLNVGKRLYFTFAVVQPGVSAATLSAKLSFLLACADDSIINGGHEPLMVLGSEN